MSFKFSEQSCYLISLASREDRRALFVENTNDKGFEHNTFEWIQAIEDQDFGGLGCAKSHVLAMSKFITSTENQYCCIFEDDFKFRETKDFSERLIHRAISDFHSCNVFLLGGTFVTPIPTNSELETHKINKVFEANSASGYLIKRKYVPRLMNAFMTSILGMEEFRAASPRKVIYDRFAIDETWKRLQRSDDWYCSTPMLGEQIASYSDIEKKDVDYSEYSA
jgi:GR25 family glycosyltransferase involved in LPS biosynthesis